MPTILFVLGWRFFFYSNENRVALLNEGNIGLNKVKLFAVNIPEAFFTTKGYKRIVSVLTYNPPTRSTRGDSYIGNRLNFKLFHTINPDELLKKYAELNMSEMSDDIEIPESLALIAWQETITRK